MYYLPSSWSLCDSFVPSDFMDSLLPEFPLAKPEGWKHANRLDQYDYMNDAIKYLLSAL